MKLTIPQFHKIYTDGKKIVAITAYDTLMGRIADNAGIDLILVGDSMGMTILGYKTTIPVTLDQSIHHTQAVVRGVERGLVIGDMPFLTFQISAEEALRNAGRFMQEAGADGVKLEGGSAMAPTVSRLVNCGIPVLGHIGLLPQKVLTAGGYRVHGRTSTEADALIDDALALQNAGAFGIVVEGVTEELGGMITEKLDIPTIGIGAGPHCDGQIQVAHDILGLFDEFVPKHTKRYAELGKEIHDVFRQYADDVTNQKFPG